MKTASAARMVRLWVQNSARISSLHLWARHAAAPIISNNMVHTNSRDRVNMPDDTSSQMGSDSTTSDNGLLSP